MSKMTEAIDRIAACAEQRKFMSCLRGWMICSGYDSSFGSDPAISTKNLTPEQIKELQQGAGGYLPRLSSNQIEEITKDYPFQLPKEIYDLYQKGNGCLPIGSDKDSSKDWDYFDNYFIFPNLDEPFYSLEMGMERYVELAKFGNRYRYNIDPRLFPISEFEAWMHVVMGSEEQEQTSPVFRLDADCLLPHIEYIEWPSLTNMMLAWAEVMERNLKQNDRSHREEIIAIRQRFGWRR